MSRLLLGSLRDPVERDPKNRNPPAAKRVLKSKEETTLQSFRQEKKKKDLRDRGKRGETYMENDAIDHSSLDPPPVAPSKAAVGGWRAVRFILGKLINT